MKSKFQFFAAFALISFAGCKTPNQQSETRAFQEHQSGNGHLICKEGGGSQRLCLVMNQFCEKKWENQHIDSNVNSINSSAFWGIENTSNGKVLYSTLERDCGGFPAGSKVTPGGDLLSQKPNTLAVASLMNVNVAGDGSGRSLGAPSYRLLVGYTDNASSIGGPHSSMIYRCAMNASNNGDAVQFKSFSNKSDGGVRGLWYDAQPGGKNECMPVELISFASGSAQTVDWDSLSSGRAGGTSGNSDGEPDQNLKSEIYAYTFILKNGKILVADPVDGVKWEQFTGRENSHFVNPWSYWYRNSKTNAVENVGYPYILAKHVSFGGRHWGYEFYNKQTNQALKIKQGEADEKVVSGEYINSSGTALQLCETKDVSNEDKARSAVFPHLAKNGFPNVTLDQFCYYQWLD